MIEKLQNQLNAFACDVDRLQNACFEIESLWIEIHDAKDKVGMAALKGEIKLKAKTIEEFKKGLTHT